MKRHNRWSIPVALLLTLSMLTAACADPGSANTEASTTTLAQGGAVEESSSNDTARSPEPPSDDAEADLVWTEAALSGDTFIDDVIVTPEGFIAYSTAEDAQAWVSQDGINWSEVDLDLGTAAVADFHGVTTGGPGYVALSSTSERDHVLWTSDDGLNWESHPLDLEIPPGEFDGFHEVVSFDGGLLLRGSFIARNGDEHHAHSVILAYSEDGISWELLPDHEILFGPGAQVGDIISTSSGLLATGFVEEEEGGERLWLSVDGRTWEKSPADFLDSPGFYLGPGTVRWGDAVLVVGNSDQGIRLHTSVDGRDWEELPSGPLLDNTEEFSVYVQQVAAGPFGIAIIAQYEPAQPTLPGVTIEKDGVAVTIDFENGLIAVEDLATGTMILETNIEDEDLVKVDDEDGTVRLLDPSSGEELTSFSFEELELAMDKALSDAGYEDPGIVEPEPPVLLFSVDGQGWSSVSTEEIVGPVGPDYYWMETVVGMDAVVVRFPDLIEHEEDSGEEPAALYGDRPNLIWVGRAGSES